MSEFMSFFNTNSASGPEKTDSGDTSEPEPESEPEEEPDEEPASAADAGKPSTGFLAGLNSSFLDDLTLGATSKPETEPAPEPAHTTQLAEQLDRSNLIVETPKSDIRVPEFTPDSADLAVRWKRFITNLPEESSNAASTLEKSSMRLEGDSAYIVFANEDAKLMTNLKKAPALRVIAPSAKKEFSAEHLFLCTEDQYRNMLKAKQDNEAQLRAEEFEKLAQEKGINTTVHFGDDD